MKKLTYLATLAGSMLIAASCVDLNQEPQSFISDEEYFSQINQESLETSVSALYNNLWHDNYGFNSRIQRIQVCADEITYRAAKPGNELAYYDQLSPNIGANTADFDTSWELFYFTIANANKIIHYSAAPADATKEEVAKFNGVLAEAYFLRGLSYFYLVRMYGNIPIIPENGYETVINCPLSKPEEVYTKMIVPSLEYAETWLPEKPRLGNSSTPTKWAAKTCLADVYITMAGWPLKKGQEYYAKAAKAAKDVLDNNGYHDQMTDYAELWKETNKNNSEFMFCLHHSHANKVMASNYGKSYYPADFYNKKEEKARNGWADYYARKEAFENYPDDERKEWNFMTEWYSTSNSNNLVQWQDSPDKLPCISKYYNYDQGNPGENAQANGVTCIYRLADAKLLYAEASTRATGSVNQDALDAINEIQKRAGYEDANIALTTTTDPQAFLEEVSKERSYEFFAEMRRWFELVRTEQVSVKRADKWNGSFFQTQGHYYFPIPSAQILLTGWENNKGY